MPIGPSDPVLLPFLTAVFNGAPNTARASFCHAGDNYRLLSARVREENSSARTDPATGNLYRMHDLK